MTREVCSEMSYMLCLSLPRVSYKFPTTHPWWLIGGVSRVAQMSLAYMGQDSPGQTRLKAERQD